MACIAVNTRLLIHGRVDGIARFAAETLRHMVLAHPEHRFVFFFDRAYHPSFIFADNVTPVVVWPQARHPWLFRFWFEKRLPSLLKKHQTDVFLSPDGFLSLSSHCKQVAVIHDLNFEHYPDYLPAHITRYYRRYFPLFAHKATRIATVSEFSKKDIVLQYKVDEKKMDVVYNGISPHFLPVSEEVKKQICEKYTQGNAYFIFTGSLHPRKNISGLLLAFEHFKKQKPSSIKLVLAGNKMWWTSEMQAVYNTLTHKHDVIFTGALPDDELSLLVASAQCLVYPSFFEGFGIPVIEAQACEVPVICSHSTSLPEVAADSAYLVNPKNIEDIARAMQDMCNESNRANWIEKGRENMLRFSWKRTAELLYTSLEKALHA